MPEDPPTGPGDGSAGSETDPPGSDADAPGTDTDGPAGSDADPPTGAFKIDFEADGTAVRWHLTDDGAEPVRDPAWTPAFYVAGPDDVLEDVATRLRADRRVVGTGTGSWFLSLDADERTDVLRVDAADPREVRGLARRVREAHERAAGRAPGTLRLYNVDLSPEFRYCLETGTDPTPPPGRDLRTMELSLDEHSRVARDVSAIRVDDEPVLEVVGDEVDVDGDASGDDGDDDSDGNGNGDGDSNRDGDDDDGDDGSDDNSNGDGDSNRDGDDDDGDDGSDGIDGTAAGDDGTADDDGTAADDETAAGDGEAATAREAAALRALDAVVRERDPDVFVVNSGEVVPLAFERAAELDVEFQLGRRPGYEQLAGENTFTSYGQVGHSSARYDVPGRVVLDTSNSFLWAKSSLAGLLDLVGRSGRPLQETGWASIGTVLTAIELREAYAERDVLAPWNKWEPERFTDVRTLHAADRGGHTREPTVGYHEDAWELDFASLYPRVICEHNISPETVCCACHADRDDVPNLGYSICDEPGFLPHVLRSLVDDRGAYKAWLRAVDRAELPADTDLLAVDPAVFEGALDPVGGDGGDGDGACGDGCDGDGGDGEGTTPEAHDVDDLRAADLDRSALEPGETPADLRAKVGALKWVLVSCFGYQGYRNAKFGRIECHEAINAVARDTFLAAKDELDAAGWELVHGIVDSLWVTAAVDDPEPLGDVVERVTAMSDIPLEREARYDWVCFCPTADGRRGALTRYFGRKAPEEVPEGADPFKVRGIEIRQRSTPGFVADVQRDLLEVVDRDPDPAAVCDRLRRHLRTLERGEVDPTDLVIRTRASKAREAYSRDTRTAAALDRAADLGFARSPGQDVRYVVVDDDVPRRGGTAAGNLTLEGTREGDPGVRRGACRVRLAAEEPDDYDVGAYRDLLVRAAESVTGPFGWDRERIRRYLRADEATSLSAFD